MELSYSAFLFSPLVYIYLLQVYFTLSGRSYLSDFLIVNRCGSNQAWMWLEKLNSGVIHHSSLSVSHYELCRDDIGDLPGSPEHL